MSADTMFNELEQNRVAVGHWHIEGYCALRAGRIWIVKESGCQSTGADNPRELPQYRTSLAMVRDYIRTQIFN